MTTRRVTSYDVAALAGVSQSAVSRAFSEEGSVSPRMRERITRAADELGYRPNAIARSLGKGRTGLVGMVINKHSQQNHANALSGITEILRTSGGGVLLQVVDADSLADDAVATLLDYRVDAIICSSIVSEAATGQCARAGVALCLVNRQSAAEGVDEVLSDNVACSTAVALGLASAGARRTAYVYGPAAGFVSRLRFAGFSAGCARAGLPPPLRIDCDFTYQGGHDAALELVERHPELDAIAAASDGMAFGIVDALRRRCGLAVPADIMVVGHDDEPTSGYLGYRLTSVRQPMEAMLRGALTLAQRRIERPELPKRRIVMRSEIMLRDSGSWEIDTSDRRRMPAGARARPAARSRREVAA